MKHHDIPIPFLRRAAGAKRAGSPTNMTFPDIDASSPVAAPDSDPAAGLKPPRQARADPLRAARNQLDCSDDDAGKSDHAPGKRIQAFADAGLKGCGLRF